MSFMHKEPSPSYSPSAGPAEIALDLYSPTDYYPPSHTDHPPYNYATQQPPPNTHTHVTQEKASEFVFTSRKGGPSFTDTQPQWAVASSLNYEETKLRSMSDYTRIIWMDKDAKNLLLYIIVVAIFSLIEILYGAKEESLGLLSKGFQTLFDGISMTISLFALIASRLEPNKRYSYGYDRIEILLGFANGSFLLFVSLFLYKEAIETLLDLPESQSQEKVIPIAFVGLLLNIVGVVFYGQHIQTRSEIRTRTRKDSSIALRILTGVVGGVCVIISSWLVQWNEWQVADVLVALLIASMIAYNAVPICKRTGKVLLQTTPEAIRHGITKCLSEATTFEGVLECHDTHFWTHAPGVFVGTISVRVRSDANVQVVLQHVTRLFSPFITYLTIQVEKDDWVLSSCFDNK